MLKHKLLASFVVLSSNISLIACPACTMTFEEFIRLAKPTGRQAAMKYATAQVLFKTAERPTRLLLHLIGTAHDDVVDPKSLLMDRDLSNQPVSKCCKECSPMRLQAAVLRILDAFFSPIKPYLRTWFGEALITAATKYLKEQASMPNRIIPPNNQITPEEKDDWLDAGQELTNSINEFH